MTGVVVNLVVFTLVLAAFTGVASFDIVQTLLHSTAQSGVSVAAILIASAAAFVVATLWNFALNNLWTFRTQRGHHHARSVRLLLYYVVSLGSLGVNELVLYLLVPFVAPLYGQAAGIVAGSIVGFAGNRRYTFQEAEAPASV